MAPSTPPPPKRVVLAALTTASTSSVVISPRTARIVLVTLTPNANRIVLAYLKEVVPVGAVELAAQHATPLEIYAQSRTGMGRSVPTSPSALCCRSRRDRPV